jgi:hypothetical protein
MDVQILSTGLTDRNVFQFLGVIEDRIDILIQMAKAASNQGIKRDDFVLKTLVDDKNHLYDGPAVKAPQLPSLAEGTDHADEDDERLLRIQPVNIQRLMEQMQRRVARGLSKKRLMSSNASLRSLGSMASRGSRVSMGSMASLKSSGSEQSAASRGDRDRDRDRDSSGMDSPDKGDKYGGRNKLKNNANPHSHPYSPNQPHSPSQPQSAGSKGAKQIRR